MSYDIMTPSAARGILEAIYWKPEIRWTIDRIHVLKPVRFTTMRRNEVGAKIGEAAAAKAMREGSGTLGLYVEDARQQRASLLLRDVDYVIEGRFEILGGDNNVGKHLDMFNRRARNGQCFTRPYLGCREFAADFALVGAEEPLPAPEPELFGDRDLGWMLHDIDFADGRVPKFFHAQMRNGIVDIPSLPHGGTA